MRLLTYQPPGFSLTEGTVDHLKSEYFKIPQVKQAYPLLWKRIGTNGNVIWCYTSQGRYKKTSREMIESVLDVPESNVRLVDETVWNYILQLDGVGPPKKYRDQVDAEARRIHPSDRVERSKFISEKYKAFWARQAPSGDWWNHLIIRSIEEAVDSEAVSAIVAHPLPKEWILSSGPAPRSLV